MSSRSSPSDKRGLLICGPRVLVRASEIQENLAATLVVLNCFLDLERLVFCRVWDAQSSGSDYFGRLSQPCRNFGKKLFVRPSRSPGVSVFCRLGQLVADGSASRPAKHSCSASILPVVIDVPVVARF